MRKRRTFPEAMALIASLSILVGLGCGCGGGGGAGAGAAPVAPTLSASFVPSGTATATDLVRLRGGAAAGDVIDVEVALGGPTTSSDLYSVAFDLVIADPSVVRLERASAGGALTVSGGQSRNVQASTSGNHLVVGVSKLGGGAGNGISAGEAVVVTLTLKVLKAGATTLTFSGPPGAGPSSGPAALDSAGQVVRSVRFDASSVSVTAH